MRSPLWLPALLLAVGCVGDVRGPVCNDVAEACDPADEPEDLVAPPEDPAATPPNLEAAAASDGVQKIYPTVPGGREWYLPANAQSNSSTWEASNGGRGKMVTTGTAGTFRVRGGPRLPVKAPGGTAWFRNVEVTGYYKLREKITGDEEMSPTGNYGYQLIVRGERHREGTIAKNKINGGVAPPSGTAAGPGYPFSGSGSVDAHCLAASYHLNMNVDGRVLFKKEVSHTAGYTSGQATQRPFPSSGAMQTGKWYGFKFVVRNKNHNTGVHLEAWLDKNADGHWTKVTEADDTGWNAQDGGIDGCAAAPFGYKKNQLVLWAGPMVLFRFDNVEADVKSFSVREIAPL